MGLKVCSFKSGCDYIDGTYHSRILGNTPHNLDSTFCTTDTLKYILCENSKGADVSIIEGVMGYYDGIGFTTKSSTYELSKTTSTPVVLIVDCHGMGASIGAVLKGYLDYQKDNLIKGVIFNRISPTLYESACEYALSLGITPLGYVPKLKPELLLQSRHLGLFTADELLNFDTKVSQLAEEVSKTIDVKILLEISKADDLNYTAIPHLDFKGIRVAVSKDVAFSFLYGDNIDFLKRSNCEIVYFSPLHDRELPKDIHGVILCGGYPEIHARELSSNATMLSSIKDAIANGIPYIAECGGFMYLQSSISYLGESYPMVGVFNGECYQTDRLKRFGYVSLQAIKDSTIPMLDNLVAHEFHYSDSTNNGTDYTATKLSNSKTWQCIHGGKNYYAGYPHIYYYGNIQQINNFLKECLNYAKSRQIH
jgi:cobyrinic acid a,c-diamide synthase